jgi:uncharacterized protein YndB with AHSA1/START domain
MSRDAYQPGPARNAEARREHDRWTMVMVRDVDHAPAKVWQALTDPAQLREWAPFDSDRDLSTAGTATLTTVGGATADTIECTVTRAERPALLEYTWGTDVLRWELEPIETGTRLTLRHTLQDATWTPKVAAGWHTCLDVMERALAGAPIGRIVAAEAKRFGWERLNAEYAERFGVENTGWPDQIPAS